MRIFQAMKKSITTVLFLGAYFAPIPWAVAQGNMEDLWVDVSLEESSLRIGEQTKLNVIIETTAISEKFLIPLLTDTTLSGIEVLSLLSNDTAYDESNRIKRIHQQYLITSFDSGRHEVPGFRFFQITGQDTVLAMSQAIYLDVTTVPIEPEAEIKDIKDIADVSLSLMDYLNWILLAVVLIILSVLGYYLYSRYKKGKPIVSIFQKPPLPPHTLALNNFEELRRKKLWQQGRIKEFHSGLTDILRIYIEGRFAIPAMEMVTVDILQAIHDNKEIEPLSPSIQYILQLADLVKFAKAEPLPDEHEKSLQDAIHFVKATMQVASVSPANSALLEAPVNDIKKEVL